MKAEGPPCFGPCPDPGWLPCTRNPGRDWGRKQAAQTERPQEGPRLPFPQGPGLTGARMEGINTQGTSNVRGSVLGPGIIYVVQAKLWAAPPPRLFFLGLYLRHVNFPG